MCDCARPSVNVCECVRLSDNVCRCVQYMFPVARPTSAMCCCSLTPSRPCQSTVRRCALQSVTWTVAEISIHTAYTTIIYTYIYTQCNTTSIKNTVPCPNHKTHIYTHTHTVIQQHNKHLYTVNMV